MTFLPPFSHFPPMPPPAHPGMSGYHLRGPRTVVAALRRRTLSSSCHYPSHLRAHAYRALFLQLPPLTSTPSWATKMALSREIRTTSRTSYTRTSRTAWRLVHQVRLGVYSAAVVQAQAATPSRIICHTCGCATAHCLSRSPLRIIIFTALVRARVSFNPSEYGIQMAVFPEMGQAVDMEGEKSEVVTMRALGRRIAGWAGDELDFLLKWV